MSAKKNIQAKPANQKSKQEAPAKGVSPLLILGGIVLLTLLLYSNALNNAILTFDDNEYFQNYPEVRNLSWESIKKYFTGYYVIMYQPLPVLSFAINYHFTQLSVFPLHMVNVFLHIVCVILVYHFVKRLFENNTIALLTALLFAIHPMNTEAVSWISARSSSMYTMFYLLALIQYVNYIKSGGLKYILYTGLFFILSLFSKAQAVTLPVVLLLLDFYFNRALLSKKVILEKVPFFMLSVVFGLVAISNSGTMRNLTDGMLINYTIADYPFLVSWSFAFYFIKLVLPINLCAVYVFPPKENGLLPWDYYASLLFFVAIVYLLYKFRKNKVVILCLGLFFVTIAINIQIIPSRLFIVTDRYAYFPYIGLFMLPLALLFQMKESNTFLFKKYFTVGLVSIALLTVFFSALVYQRNQVWNNDVMFLTDIIEKNPRVQYLYRAYGNRGMAYKRTGKTMESIADFTEAIKINPTDGRNFFNRGLTYATAKLNKEAVIDFDQALKLDPNQPLIYSNRAQVRFLLNDTTGAESDCIKTIELDSLNIDAYNTLANVYFSKNNLVAAEQTLNKVVTINPNFAIGFKNRGIIYFQTNRKAEACSDWLTASNLNFDEAKQLYTQYCK